MKVIVIASRPEYAGAPMLARAIRETYNCHVDEMYGDKKGYDFPVNKNCFTDCVTGYEKMIICGGTTLNKFVGNENYDERTFIGSTVILSDSYYLKHAKGLSAILDRLNCKIYAMPGILPVSGGKPFYHVTYLPKMQIKKHDFIVASHSPGMKYKTDVKGTRRIINACIEIGLLLDVITGEKWIGCIKRKAKTKIFIDHVIDKNPDRFGQSKYFGDMGKSGIEAMLLGNLVITSGKPADTQPYFPNAPIVFCTKKTLKEVLEHYSKNKKALEDKIQEQTEWANKWLRPDFIARHVMGEP